MASRVGLLVQAGLLLCCARWTSGAPPSTATVISNSGQLLFFANEQPNSWSDAQQFCQGGGGRLVELRSDTLQSEIESLLSRSDSPIPANHGIWIGLQAATNVNQSTSYKWASGEPLTYTDWVDGAPFPQTRGSACGTLFLHQYSPPAYGWTNGDCSTSQHFMCQAEFSTSNCLDLATSTTRMTFRPCPPNAGCLFFQYACCNAGLEPDDSRQRCIDVDECLSSPCHDDAICNNTLGSFECRCKTPFVGNGFECEDEEHLCNVADPTSCPANSTCVRSNVGENVCRCHLGFSLVDSGYVVECVDINECEVNVTHTVIMCGENSHCTNTVGSFICPCDAGYTRTNAGQPFSACQDDNECDLSTHNCSHHATCDNTEGGFECRCVNGYQGDGMECDDFDECDAGQQRCHIKALCTNTNGSYACACKSGFEGDGYNCEDTNECDVRNSCGQHSTCVNTVGSYSCQCWTGFKDVNGNCTDIDECVGKDGVAAGSGQRHNCPAFSSCNNTVGSYTCPCNSGYVNSTFGHRPYNVLCRDIDECAAPKHPCPAHSTCTNTEGSYKCVCVGGYLPYRGRCLDVDECNTGIHDCHGSAYCSNLPGNFECRCYQGSSLDATGKMCLIINLCALGRHNCNDNAHCVPGNSSFSCRCNNDYEGDPILGCTPIDKCARRLHGCRVDHNEGNEICVMDGTDVNCPCRQGYRRSMTNLCVRIDPCLEDLHNCTEDFVCVTTPTSFECRCHRGYELTVGGEDCEKIDYCTLGTHNCTAVVEECVLSGGDDGGSGFLCRCAIGYERSGTSMDCININECNVGVPCDRLASCTDSPGSYSCTCRRGFQGSGVHCSDRDECSDGSHGCHGNAHCNNTFGSYQCSCRENYLGDGRACREDSCVLGSHDCHANADCLTTSVSYDCTCVTGYIGNGFSCKPLFPKPCIADTVVGNQGVFRWPKTFAGTAPTSLPCPLGSFALTMDATATRRCVWDADSSSPLWLPADTFNCRYRSETSNNLFYLAGKNITLDNAIEIGQQVEMLTLESVQPLDAVDVSFTSTVLQGLASVQTVVRDSTELEDSVLSTVDGIIRNAPPEAIAESQRLENASSRLLHTIEQLAAQVQLKGYTSRTLLRNDVQVSVADIPLSIEPGFRVGLSILSTPLTLSPAAVAAPTAPADPPVAIGSSTFQLFVEKDDPRNGVASISFPSDALLLRDGDGTNRARVSFSVFSGASLFPVITEQPSYQPSEYIDSMVISATVAGKTVENLSPSKPVNIILKRLGRVNNGSDGAVDGLVPSCVFWDFAANGGLGDWSASGCQVAAIDDEQSTVHCQCTHLTNFAILLVPKVPTSAKKGLTYLTLIGASVSLLGCILTIITLMVFRRFLQQIQLRIILQISIALTLTLATLLAGATATEYRIVCVAVSALLQFFPLVIFCWTLVQIFHLHRVLVRVFHEEIDMFFTKSVMFAWGLPFIIVFATMCAGVFEFKDYGGEEYCRLQGISFYAGYFAPICFILLVDVVFFLRLLCVIAKPKPDQLCADFDDHKRNIKVAFSLITVLGLTWIFGAFTLVPYANVIFTYIFTGLNVIQGFTVFLAHILLRPEIREAWVKLLCRHRRGQLSMDESKQASLNSKRRMSAPENLTMSTMMNRSKRDSYTNSPQDSRRSSLDFGVFRHAVKHWTGTQFTDIETSPPPKPNNHHQQNNQPNNKRINSTIIENEFAAVRACKRHSGPRQSVEKLI